MSDVVETRMVEYIINILNAVFRTRYKLGIMKSVCKHLPNIITGLMSDFLTF